MSARTARKDSQRSRLTRDQRAAQRAFEQAISERMDELRETAESLFVWWRANAHVEHVAVPEGGRHPVHVVNRVRKIANSISKPKPKG